RPQGLLVGMACGAIATIVRWRDDRRGVVIAALVGGVVIAASYGGAALASDPPNEYLSAVRLQSQWVHNVDSYHNPHRTPLGVLAPIFFFKPIASNAVEIVSALAALGTVFAIVRVRVPALVTAVTFVPIAIFAWLMLDAMAVSRYAI